jgi:hypothetical protein
MNTVFAFKKCHFIVTLLLWSRGLHNRQRIYRRLISGQDVVFAFKPGGYIAKQLSEMQVVIQVFASKKRVLLSNEHSVLLSKEHSFCFQTGRVPLRSLRTNYQKCKSSFRSRACKGCLAVCWHSSKVPTVGRHRWRGVLLCTSL